MNNTGVNDWEPRARQLAEQSLMHGFSIYDFSVSYSKNETHIKVYLDKLNDEYGSPKVEDCEQFSTLYSMKLDALEGNGEIPSNYSLEVSSPGAERELKLPQELDRFKQLPMKVFFMNENEKPDHRILNYVSMNETISKWRIADVKANRKAGLISAKKTKPAELNIPVDQLNKVQLFVDI